MGSSDIDAVLNDTKDYIQSTYHGLKEFDDDLFRTDNASVTGNFILVKESSKFIKRYKTYQDEYSVKIRTKKALTLYDLYLVFEQIVSRIKKQYKLAENARLRFVIEHVKLDNPISTEWLRL